MTKKLKKKVKNSKVDIKVKNEGLLEVPEGKKVDELPLKHFEELVDKKGYDKVIKALNNLQVWNKNDDKELSNWAEDTMKKLKKKFRPETSAETSKTRNRIIPKKDEVMRLVSRLQEVAPHFIGNLGYDYDNNRYILENDYDGVEVVRGDFETITTWLKERIKDNTEINAKEDAYLKVLNTPLDEYNVEIQYIKNGKVVDSIMLNINEDTPEEVRNEAKDYFNFPEDIRVEFDYTEFNTSAKRKPVTKSLYKSLNPNFTGLLQYGREGHFENGRDNDLYAICEKRYWLNDKYPNSDKLEYTEIITDPAKYRYVYRIESIYDTDGNLIEETSARNSIKDIWKEIVNKYVEYIVPEIWAGFNTRQGRILTRYIPIEEVRKDEYYTGLKERYNSLDKLPKSFVSKVYSLYESFEDEEGLQELEEFNTDLDSFKKFISEFGTYLFASKDSFEDWLSNLEYKLWKNSPEQLEKDKKLQEARERALNKAKFKEGDLVVLKDNNKVFKVKHIRCNYGIDDTEFKNITLVYELAYPQSNRYCLDASEDEIELYKSDTESSKKDIFKADDKVRIKAYPDKIYTIQNFNGETYKLKELGFSRYSPEELELVQEILSTKERLQNAMKKIKVSASGDEKITELVNKYAPHNRGWEWESNHKAITVYFKDVHSSYAEDECDDLLKALYPKYLDDVMVANSARKVEGSCVKTSESYKIGDYEKEYEDIYLEVAAILNKYGFERYEDSDYYFISKTYPKVKLRVFVTHTGKNKGKIRLGIEHVDFCDSICWTQKPVSISEFEVALKELISRFYKTKSIKDLGIILPFFNEDSSKSYIKTSDSLSTKERLQRAMKKIKVSASGDEALGFGNTKIQVGDEVETIDGETGKVIKRYHDFAGQLRYRVELKDEVKSFSCHKVRLLTDVEKEKELKNKKKKYSVDDIKNMLLRICREYNLGWDTDRLKVRDTVNNSILITGIPRIMTPHALYSTSTVEHESKYFSEIINSVLKYFNKLGIPCHFANEESINRGRLELYLDETAETSSTKERLQKAMKKIKNSAVELTKGIVYTLKQDFYYAPLEYAEQYVDEEDYAKLEESYYGTYKGEDYIVIPKGTKLVYTGHDMASDYFKILDIDVEIPTTYFDPEDTMMIQEGLEYASKKRQVSTKNSATEELTKVPSKTKVGKLLDSLFPACDIEMKFPSKTVFDKDVIKENLDKSKKHEYLAQSSKRKVNNSKRYELFDKYDGEYCYTVYDSSLLFDAQREWDDAKEQGEYVAVPRPKTKEDAYEFFKSIYDIDVWTDEEWKKHCEEVGIENCSTEKGKYVVTELIGNFGKIVFKSDDFYEVQDYIADRWQKHCEENNIDPSDEKESELFHSYFSIQEMENSASDWNWKFEKTRKGIRLVGTQGNQKVVLGYDGQMETFYTEVTRDVTLPYDKDNHEYVEGFIDIAEASYSLREWHETNNTEHVLVDNFEYPAEEINKFHQLVRDIYFGDVTYKTHEEALDHEMKALQELDELEHGEIKKSTKTSSKTFEDNLDLMTEFLQIKDVKDWDKFVGKHPSISDNDMDDTNAKITPEVLADLFRQAENAYQDEMNGRETDLNVTSEEAKDAISNYVYNSGYLSESEQKEFEELCNAMGC